MQSLSPSKARTQLSDNIGATLNQALQMRIVLEDEREALRQQDLQAIEAAVDRKTACLRNLQALDQQRDQLCNACGFASGHEQMQLCMDWCDEGNCLNDHWAQLMTTAAEGSAINMTNGAIIRVRQQQFESSLSVLRGVPPGSDTYGRNGTEGSDFSRRSLAEA